MAASWLWLEAMFVDIARMSQAVNDKEYAYKIDNDPLRVVCVRAFDETSALAKAKARLFLRYKHNESQLELIE